MIAVVGANISSVLWTIYENNGEEIFKKKNIWGENVQKIFGEYNVRKKFRGGQCPKVCPKKNFREDYVRKIFGEDNVRNLFREDNVRNLSGEDNVRNLLGEDNVQKIDQGG